MCEQWNYNLYVIQDLLHNSHILQLLQTELCIEMSASMEQYNFLK